MKPWEAEAVEWDEGNESELSPHAITPRDVEDVLQNGPVWVPNKKGRSGDYKAIGSDRGGRALTIVVVCDDIRRTVRPITGWLTTPSERSKYS